MCQHVSICSGVLENVWAESQSWNLTDKKEKYSSRFDWPLQSHGCVPVLIKSLSAQQLWLILLCLMDITGVMSRNSYATGDTRSQNNTHLWPLQQAKCAVLKQFIACCSILPQSGTSGVYFGSRPMTAWTDSSLLTTLKWINGRRWMLFCLLFNLQSAKLKSVWICCHSLKCSCRMYKLLHSLKERWAFKDSWTCVIKKSHRRLFTTE